MSLYLVSPDAGLISGAGILTAPGAGVVSGGLQVGAPLLDGFVAAAAAFSLRQLSGTATKCCNIRRSSDNAAQDILFTPYGDFDTASFISFVGNGTGLVTKWYDQSGNGKDVSQATAANQPTLTLSLTHNGHPSVVFNGVASQNLLAASNSGLVPPVTMAVYVNRTGAIASFNVIVAAASGPSGNHSPNLVCGNTASVIAVGFDSQSSFSGTMADGAFHSLVGIASSTPSLAIDGTITSGSIATSSPAGPIQIGADGAGSPTLPFTGDVSESIFFADARPPAQLSLIANNQSAYW